MSFYPDFLMLAAQFALLSLLSIGGYATVLPDVHRQLVLQRGWLDDAGFAQAVALGQSAPGPNIMVIGVLGWMAAGPLGLLACLGGILLPSTLLVWRVSRWARGNGQHPLLRAFQIGSAPLVLGLTLASGWLLARPLLVSERVAGGVLLLGLVAMGSALKPRWAPLLWIAFGAGAGVMGWV
jgi:chromate transporter